MGIVLVALFYTVLVLLVCFFFFLFIFVIKLGKLFFRGLGLEIPHVHVSKGVENALT